MLQEDSNNSLRCIKSSSNMISGFKHFKYDKWFQTTANMISGFKQL